MACRDEYEVARLYSDADFRRQIDADFEGVRALRLHLAPPLLLSRADPATRRPRKREFGPWIFPLLRLLPRLRGMRGTAFDIFGRSAERRAERALVDGYERRIDALLADLDPARRPLATRIAAVAEQVRGFGPVKAGQMAAAAAAWRALDAEWTAAMHAAAASLEARAA